MTVLSRVAMLLLAALLSVPAPSLATAAQPPEPPEEFLPLDQLPPQDQLPAAPLLIGAYVFVPVVLFLYLVSLARRMSGVQREIERLEIELKRSA